MLVQMNNRELKITGTGRLDILPDQVRVHLPVAAASFNFEESASLLNQKTAVLETIAIDNGLAKNALKTSNYSIGEDWRYDKKTEERVLNGFKASQNLNLTLPLDFTLVGKVLNAIAASGHDITFQLYFDVANKASHNDELIKKAIADAERAAFTICAAAQIKLGNILRIDYSFSELHIQEHMFMAADSAAGFSDISINPEEISAEKNITMVWEIIDWQLSRIEKF